MNFTQEDYATLRVHFSIHVDPDKLNLLSEPGKKPRDCTEDGNERIVVGVVGNCPELGSWNPYNALQLVFTRAQPNVWSGSVVIQTQNVRSTQTPPSPESASKLLSASSSTSLKTIEYKYIILKKMQAEESEADRLESDSSAQVNLELIRWETIVGNRKINVPLDVLSVDVFDGNFGAIKEDNRALYVDEGWLSDANKLELRINLGTYQKYGSTPLKIYNSKYKDTPFKIHIFLIDYPSKGRLRKRFHVQLSRWKYANELDTVGRPGIFRDEEVDSWKDGDIQIFSILTSSLENKAIEINILSTNPKEELIGKAIIIPQMVLPPMQNKEHRNLNNNRNGGHLNLPIMGFLNEAESMNSLTIIGELNCNYLIARPFIHAENNLATLWRTHWSTTGRTLDIGHRGMGRSYNQVEPYPKAYLTENTILSLVAAAQNGADFVEFDVHLTKDFVPVLYHDLSFYVELKRTWFQDKKKAHNTYKESMEVSVNQLTLEQLRRVKTHPIPKHKHIFQNLLREHWNDILRNMSSGPDKQPEEIPPHLKSIYEFSPEQIKRFKTLIEQVPTLEEALKAVPQHVGFNIEIKYPETTTEKITFFEMNFFVDTILKTIFDHAGSRRIILSCFDPDICTLCRLKQPRYPVFFLTSGGHIDVLEDVRCNSIEQALMFAKSERLLGIIPCSTPLLQNLKLIDRIKEEGIILFTWGDDNNDEKNIRLQRQHGVDAVIYDNIGTSVQPFIKLDKSVSVMCGTKTPQSINANTPAYNILSTQLPSAKNKQIQNS
jgi:glycerophosphoryl diester phosphodiesterase